MQELTSRERIERILKREPVDRIGLCESFWSDTRKAWIEAGDIPADVGFEDLFGFDIARCGCLNLVADLDFKPEVIEEDEETSLSRDGNGALMRRHKLHASTPEHVDFTVKDRIGWEEFAKPKLTFDRRRLNFEAYRNARRHAAEKERFFCWTAAHAFELMKNIAGHENMLVGMALDPDWVRDMANTYSRMLVEHMETLFAEEGKPDGIWFYEDMGFKQHPFMSPEMYEEIMLPAHRATFEFAHSLGLPVVVHSCGYVEPLIPGLIEAGMDCLQVMEVKAGMDCRRLKKEYGDRISFIGGIDVRKLYTNDLAQIEQEIMDRVPAMMEGSGYVLHSDHSIPNTVNYASYRFFVERGLEVGTYR
jgi:uroporphyrinogen decarboxylase